MRKLLALLVDPSSLSLALLAVGLFVVVGVGWALVVVGAAGFIASEVAG